MVMSVILDFMLSTFVRLSGDFQKRPIYMVIFLFTKGGYFYASVSMFVSI